jgi:hypothetical protein
MIRFSASERKAVRFSRWSRKPYAIFLSLKICVVIGRLRKEVADSSLSKTGKLGFILYGAGQSPYRANEEEERDSGPPLLAFLEQPSVCNTLCMSPFSLQAVACAETGRAFFANQPARNSHHQRRNEREHILPFVPSLAYII